MFLHIGADTVVPLRKVIAIIDYKEVSINKNRQYINDMRSQDKVIDVSEGIPGSFVITDDLIFFSPVSGLTLKRRAEGFLGSDEDCRYISVINLGGNDE